MLPIDNIFLQVLGRVLAVVDRYISCFAVRAATRGWNVDADIVLSWCFSIPTDMPDRSSAFARVLLGVFTILPVVRFGFLFVGREFVLPDPVFLPENTQISDPRCFSEVIQTSYSRTRLLTLKWNFLLNFHLARI